MLFEISETVLLFNNTISKTNYSITYDQSESQCTVAVINCNKL